MAASRPNGKIFGSRAHRKRPAFPNSRLCFVCVFFFFVIIFIFISFYYSKINGRQQAAKQGAARRASRFSVTDDAIENQTENDETPRGIIDSRTAGLRAIHLAQSIAGTLIAPTEERPSFNEAPIERAGVVGGGGGVVIARPDIDARERAAGKAPAGHQRNAKHVLSSSFAVSSRQKNLNKNFKEKQKF